MKMKRLYGFVFSLACSCVFATAMIAQTTAPADERTMTPVGLAAMHMEHLPYLNRASMFQWTSFSHPSANDDDFYYPDPHAKSFNSMIDGKGPGCFYSWWSAGGMAKCNPRLKIYLDGETEPRLDGTIADLVGKGKPGQHDICVDYLNGEEKPELTVSYKGPKISLRSIPNEALIRKE